MDSVIDDLLQIEHRCKQGAALFEADEVKSVIKNIKEAADEIGRAWSGSCLGYHSRVYYDKFQPPPRGATFSSVGGLDDKDWPSNTRGNWKECSSEEVDHEVLRRAGSPDLKILETAANKAQAIFNECKIELLTTLDALLAENQDQRIQRLRDDAARIKLPAETEILQKNTPRQESIISSDIRAVAEGISVPPHLRTKLKALALDERKHALDAITKAVQQVKLYMEKRTKLQGQRVARTEGTVFIGHGRSPVWRDLKDFIQDRLGLKPDEFNLGPAAGMTTKERLEEMLGSAIFAFLIMTAEDEHADNTKHARENVIHEAGLFQGRLGFKRAIILLEEGCSEFSNIQGLGQIRFPKGNIEAKREEIRQVLEREGLLKR